MNFDDIKKNLPPQLSHNAENAAEAIRQYMRKIARSDNKDNREAYKRLVADSVKDRGNA